MKIRISIILIIFVTVSIGQVVYPFHKKNKWFFVDSAFKRVDKKAYKNIVPCEIGYFYVSKNSKLAIVDAKGKQLTDFKFDKLFFDYVFDIFLGHIDKVVYKIDRNGKVLINDLGGHCGESIVVPYFETYIKNNKIGVLKRTQTKNINYADTFPAIYDKVLENYNGTAMVKIENWWGVINENCEYILQPQFDSIVQVDEYNLGVSGVIVVKNKLYGWLDYTNKISILPKYKSLQAFKNGYAFVTTSKNKSGYINTKGVEFFK